MGHFKRGYKPLAEEAKKQEARRQANKEKLYEFYLKDDGDEAEVRCLLEEPINVRVHQVQRKSGGKVFYDTFICTEDENCEYCNEGDNPQLKGANLLIDRRKFKYTDDKGKEKTGKDQLKLILQGTKVMGQFERISKKYGLINRDVTIVRLGKGQNTSYTVERGEEDELSTKEIKACLPEWCREEYDGSEDSLYDILEAQLDKMKACVDDDDDDDDDEYEEKTSKKSKSVTSKSRSKRYMGDDDDDDDEDEDDGDDIVDDEDEDDDEPKRSSKTAQKSKLSSKSKIKSRFGRR